MMHTSVLIEQLHYTILSRHSAVVWVHTGGVCCTLLNRISQLQNKKPHNATEATDNCILCVLSIGQSAVCLSFVYKQNYLTEKFLNNFGKIVQEKKTTDYILEATWFGTQTHYLHFSI